MMPKMLDASFLYGEKRFLKRIPNSRSEDNSNSPNSDLTFDEILASCNLDGRQKIERLISDKGLYSEFLSKAHQLNPHLHEYFYLPLIYIYLEPPAPLAFDTVDLEAMISNFGQVLKVINKEKVAYVLMRNNIECWLAVKVLNNTDIEIPAKGLSTLHKLKVLLCFEDATINHVYKFNHTEYREEAFSLVYTDKLVEELGTQYKYISIFEIDVDQTEFDIKSRILGLKGSNIIRIQYLVEKAFAFQNQEKEFSQSDVNIKILLNQDSQCNQLIIMSNNWNKFQLGQKYTNELFAQIKEEFKFFQDNQLASLKESRVKRTDKFFQPIEITYSYDNDQ